MRKYTLTILTVLSFGLIIHHEIVNYQPKDWFVYDFFKPMIIYLFGLIISIIAIFKSIGKYKTTKNKTRLIPLIVVIVGILSLLTIESSKRLFQKEIILTANYDGGTNGLRMKLFEDNSYEIHDYSYLGGNFHYGTFKIENDIIILEHEFPFRPDGKFIEDSLIISNDRIMFHKNSIGNYDSTVYFMVVTNKK